jgi:hypothetical protein
MWDNRFEIFTPVMRDLLAFMKWIGAAMIEDASPLRQQVGPEALAAEYPRAEPPAKK